MRVQMCWCACGCGRTIPSNMNWDGYHGPGPLAEPRLRPWWRRRRYSVFQVQGGERVQRHGSGLTHREARRMAGTVNTSLAWFKAIAPSGPQDAAAIIVPDEEA